MAQALLEDSQPKDAEVLTAGGFRHATDLLYLVSTVAAFPTSPPPDRLEYVPYTAERHRRLAEIVEQTYEGSLDCPGLDKVRNIEDVLCGHKATGEFDPGAG